MPEPQPAPQEQDYSWLAILIIVYLLFSRGGIGGQTAPIVSPDPNVFVAFNDDAVAVAEFDKAHPGQADVMTSLADDSVKTWVLKSQGGHWINYGIKSAPEPDPKNVDPWLVDAYKYWKDKANGKVPYIVAAGPHKKGYAGDVPDTQEAAKKALSGIAK